MKFLFFLLPLFVSTVIGDYNYKLYPPAPVPYPSAAHPPASYPPVSHGQPYPSGNYEHHSKWFQNCSYDGECEGVCDNEPDLDENCEDYEHLKWEEMCLFCQINLSPFPVNSCPNGGICICGPAFLNQETCSSDTTAKECWNAQCRGDT